MIEVTFKIPYKTQVGETLYICGDILKTMNHIDGVWSTTIKIKEQKKFSYNYMVKNEGQSFYEAGSPRVFKSSQQAEHTVHDFWRERNSSSPLLSTPFLKLFFNKKKQKELLLSQEVIFTTIYFNKAESTNIYITGNCKALGAWNPLEGVKMEISSSGVWHAGLELRDLPEEIEYKYVVIKKEERISEVIWESGPNRIIDRQKQLTTKVNVINDYPIRVEPQRVRASGIAIPLFSLKSGQSCGVGDFKDLKLMIDLVEACSMNFLQLLPINDTTHSYSWQDSYPYSAISGYALHPIYINLDALGKIKESKFNEKYQKKRAELNSLDQINWDAAIALKWSYLKKIFDQEWKSSSKSRDYKRFYKENEFWLLPYAFFSHLRDRYKTSNFREWPQFQKYCKKEALSAIETQSRYKREIEFYFFIQYHLHKQLLEATQYAATKGVVLKGDIAVGIDRNSTEAWNEPHLFNFKSQIGAPPDYFSQNGQIWGFPLYNWENIEREGYRWWKERIKNMSQYFDAFRIDHILGFFRVWQIPVNTSDGTKGYFVPAIPYTIHEIEQYGLNHSIHPSLFIEDIDNRELYHPAISGKLSDSYQKLNSRERTAFDSLYLNYFYSRNEELWSKNGLKHLQQLITGTGMLACGEDLGMIPASVPKIMDKLKILSLELERMPKGSAANPGEPALFPYLSICTTSTHDTEGVREWWVKYGQDKNKISLQDCPEKICKNIVSRHMHSPSMIAIIPLQDLLALFSTLRRENYNEERINNPANSKHNWNYRLHLNLEELINNNQFCLTIKEMVEISGRKL